MIDKFCNCFGPPGMEEAVVSLIKEALADSGLKIFEDRVGNLVVEKEGCSPTVSLNASMDEAALFINHIKDDGLLAFETAMVMPHLLVGKQVSVGKDKLPGVIGFVPIHLQRHLDMIDKPVKTTSLFIDIGCKSKKETKKLVNLGDWAVFRTAFAAGESVITGKALDNRLSVAMLVELLQSGEIKNQVRAVFTRIRKTWPWGSAAAGELYGSDYNIMMESAAADDGPIPVGQRYERRSESKLGGGAVFTVLDGGHISSIELYSHFVNQAEAKGIPYQIKQSNAGVSDASQYQTGAMGNRVLAVSMPCRYQNAPISMAKMEDYRNMKQLLIESINSLPQLKQSK